MSKDDFKQKDLPAVLGDILEALRADPGLDPRTFSRLDALDGYIKIIKDAHYFLSLYWGEDGRSTDENSQYRMKSWLLKNKNLDLLFFVHLIEAAGEVALALGYSKHKAAAAKAKNAKPRAWVLSEWQSRTDQGQSKASFARQYAPLVKKRFPKDSAAVTPETIARDWLPKVKK